MRKQAWPARLAIREGFENAKSSRILSVIVVAATALLVAGAGFADAIDTSAIARSESKWVEAGGYAFIVEAGTDKGEAALDVAACERLASVTGVRGAFALEVSDSAASPANAPGTQAAFIRVSPGVYQFFGLLAPNGPGVIATSGATESTGLSNGERTQLRVATFDGSGSVAVATATMSLLDSAILAETFDVAYLSPELISGIADQCYVQTDAAHAKTVEGYLAAALSSGPGSSAVVRPLMPATSYGMDYSTAYGDRVLRWAWAGAAAMLVAMWAVMRHTQRTRLAIYATFGATRRALLTMQLSEWTATTAIGAAWGWAIGVAFAIGADADAYIAVTQVTWQAVAAWSAGSIGAVLVGLLPVGTLLDALKDKA